ncbi:MAG: SDR family oxidoreductase [Nocardia sp.]|nr:SDR family oxidoreductase [Nocardia sp.]
MPTAVIVGASRGLGLAMAGELVERGWDVVGTVRDRGTRTPLHDLADRADGTVRVECLDVNDPEQIAALRDRLAPSMFDVLFVNAGTAGDAGSAIGSVSTEEFIEVMATNALGPMRVIEAMADLVAPAGLIGAMSSGQGSITNNTRGMRELYRGSKAALNMFMRGYAARGGDGGRALLLLAPGWIRTDLGGPDAPFSIEESAPLLVEVLLAKMDRPGLEYLDRNGATVPW